MSEKSARAYHSPLRDEQTNATRGRILSTATQLFAAHGFAAVSVARIAREAGVSLATVYLYFPGKAAIVGALADDVAAAPDLSVEHFERESDPVRQLELGAAIIRTLNERAWQVADILRSARGSDESLQQVWIQWQERHLSAMQRAVGALHARGAPRDDLSPDDAVDILYAVTGTDVYRALVHERGWSPEHYEEWLFQFACRELLDNPA